MPDGEKPPGYHKPDDPNARPGIDVCEKCARVRPPDERMPPLYTMQICWKCWDPSDDEQDSYRICIESLKEKLSEANLQYVNLAQADLANARLTSADLTSADLSGASLNGASLFKAKLKGANLTSATLVGARMERAVLTRTKTENAVLRGSHLKLANLEGADFSYANMEGTNLADVRAKGASFHHAWIHGVLQGWNMDLRDADLFDANLEGSNIWNSDLRGANLTDANLTHTSIRYCRLYGANFTKAKIDGADLREIKQIAYTKWIMFGDALLWWVRVVRKADCGRCFIHKMRRHLLVRGFVYRFVRRAHGILKRATEAREKKIFYPLFFLRDIAQAVLVVYRALIRRKARVESLTNWLGVSGVGTARMDDSFTARYIKDNAFIEEFRSRHPGWAFLWRWTCFYGQSFALWAFWCVAFALFFALLYATTGIVELDAKTVFGSGEIVRREATWLTHIYFSVVTFTTLGFGDVTPNCAAGELAVLIEVILGYIGLGGLISILANKVARRA